MSRTRMFSITNQITGDVFQNVPVNDLAETLHSMFPEGWDEVHEICDSLVNDIKANRYYDSDADEAYLNILIDLEDDK